MPFRHAVVLLDHHTAQILRYNAEQVETRKVTAHEHPTRQHGSGVRSEHEFFGEVCDTLGDTPLLLIAGAHTPLADFRHYVEKHRPALAPRIAGWETVNQPTEAQLLALARAFFVRHERMTGS